MTPMTPVGPMRLMRFVTLVTLCLHPGQAIAQAEAAVDTFLAVEALLARTGALPGEAVAPFAQGFRHAFTMARAEWTVPSTPRGVVTVRRSGGDTLFEAIPLPFPTRRSRIEPSEGPALFLDPGDLIWAAWAESPPLFEGAIVVTVLRPPAPDDGTQSPSGLRALAELASGAARLGAACLVAVQATDAPPSAVPDASPAGTLDDSQLAIPGPPPEILVLTAWPGLGRELLGRQAFEKALEAPLSAHEPGVRPWLLALEIGARAPIQRNEQEAASLLAFLAGSDPAMGDQMVIVGADLSGADTIGLKSLTEAARELASPEGRPRRGILLAAFAGPAGGLAGARALMARLPELKARPAAMIYLDAAGGTGGTARVIAGGLDPQAINLLAAAASPIEPTFEADPSPAGVRLTADYPFGLAGIPTVRIAAGDPEILARLGAALARALAGGP